MKTMPMTDRLRLRVRLATLLGLLVGSAVALAGTTSSAAGTVAAAPPSRTAPVVQHSQRGELYYARRFGVDNLEVHYTSSGSSLEFRYHVLDPDKAMILASKKSQPVMTDLKSGAKLGVPMMEKIGELRQQVSKLERDRAYWMVFANPGKRVKPGDRVDVQVGAFHVSGLTVQ